MKRLTDDRFCGDGFYVPKSTEERKEIQYKKTPTIAELYKRLAEYERAEENGLLLKLPCKVGTTVWEIKDCCKRNPGYDCINNCHFCDDTWLDVFPVGFEVYMCDFVGKTVFFTKEEAEKAVKRINGG